MNFLTKSLFKKTSPFSKTLIYSAQRAYHFPPDRFGMVSDKPGLTAKRIIKCIGERLRKVDPARWESVPITFKTHFRDENGYVDLVTCAHIHDALEREFLIEIKDRMTLITDIEMAFGIVLQSHEAI